MKNRLAGLLVAGALLAPVSAWAVPITVDFTITGTSALGSVLNPTSYNGFPLGTVGSGWFTIDDSIGNYNDLDVGLTPIDFQFDWLGVNFTEANAELWSLGFNAAGGLEQWNFGHAGVGTCGLNCIGTDGPADFFVGGWIPEYSVAAVHQTNAPGAMLGSVTWAVRTSVPEPATLALLGVGLLGMGLVRRRRS